MAKRDLRPARCFVSRPLLQARVPLSAHISYGTMLPGVPAQVVQVPWNAARLSPFRLAVQYTHSMIACWANQEFMSDKVNLYASGLVRALRSRPSAGAPEEIAHPESVLALVRPGTWELGPWLV